MEGTVTRDGRGRAGQLLSHGLMQAFWVSMPQPVLRGEQGMLWGC